MWAVLLTYLLSHSGVGKINAFRHAVGTKQKKVNFIFLVLPPQILVKRGELHFGEFRLLYSTCM